MTSKTGLLILNVGTPEAPTVPAVKRYLKEFLSDPRIISLPKSLRLLFVHGFILPFRTRNSTHAYQAIWNSETGSPLMSHSVNFQKALQSVLGENYQVVLGMRYGKPSIQEAIEQFKQQGVHQIILAPLYPQYASASTGSALESVFDHLKSWIVMPSVQILEPFYDSSYYIQANANLIVPYLDQPWDSLLLSFHGLPFSQVKATETHTPLSCEKDLPCPKIEAHNQHCYRAQCYRTAHLLGQALQIREDQYQVCFQSRVGMNRWIGPDLESVLKRLIGEDKKNLLVACPSFVADCLETLEEIGIRAKQTWQKLGGASFTLIPCLNDDPNWVTGFSKILQTNNLAPAP